MYESDRGKVVELVCPFHPWENGISDRNPDFSIECFKTCVVNDASRERQSTILECDDD